MERDGRHAHGRRGDKLRRASFQVPLGRDEREPAAIRRDLGARRARSQSPEAGGDGAQGAEQDPHVIGERPVAHVGEVEL
jgi:hypothetical protein